MLDSLNPFSDPMFKKQLLEKEGKLNQNPDNYEVLEPEEVADLKNIITSAPKLPKQAKNLILDASAISKSNSQAKVLQVESDLNTILSNYNKEYGLDLHLDLGNLSKSLVAVSDPRNRRILQLYLSNFYGSLKSVLVLHLMQRLMILIDDVLSPEKMLKNPEFTSQDQVILIEKILDFAERLSAMKSEFEIVGADLELAKIAEQAKEEGLDTQENKEAVDAFMALLMKNRNNL